MTMVEIIPLLHKKASRIQSSLVAGNLVVNIAACLAADGARDGFQIPPETGCQRDACGLLHQLDGFGRVGNEQARLDAAKIVKEPTTTGIHGLPVGLRF